MRETPLFLGNIHLFHVYPQGETCNKIDPTGDRSVLVSRTPGTGPVSVTDDYDDDDLTLLQVGKLSTSAECKESAEVSEDISYIYMYYIYMHDHL